MLRLLLEAFHMNRWLACSLVGTFAGFALITMSAPGCGGSSGTQTDGGPASGQHKQGPTSAINGRAEYRFKGIGPLDGERLANSDFADRTAGQEGSSQGRSREG